MNMGRYTVDASADHPEQAGSLLALAIEHGYGTADVHWDPATASYEAPDDVVEAYTELRKQQLAEADEEPEGDEVAEETPAPKRRGGRRKATDDSNEGAGADPEAGKE